MRPRRRSCSGSRNSIRPNARLEARRRHGRPQARLEQAVEQAHAQVDTLSAQLATQRRTIELGEAAVRLAEVQLVIARAAPFTGVVIAKAAQVGEIVSPLSAGGGFTRTGVGTIVDMDSLEVEVDVNEATSAASSPAIRSIRCSMPIRTGRSRRT
jgi:multidrug resistance efflux pump